MKNKLFIVYIIISALCLISLNHSYVYAEKIKLKNISTNFSLVAFLKKEFGIKNVSIKSKDNNLNDVVNFVRIYKNNPQLIIFEKMLKSGSISTEIELYFHKDGKLKKDLDQFLSSINDHRIIILGLDQNKGLPTALNYGIKEAINSGFEYIARMDADDVAHINRIQKQISFKRIPWLTF